MDVTPLIGADRQVVQSYAPGRFRISGKTHETPVIVFPDRTQEWDGASFDGLAAQASDLDVILFGTGTKNVPLSPDRKRALREQGLIIETMDTGAACRTYNVLMAEGRRVAAALLPLKKES
jgi:uncharacterized protein